ncbi:MAG TPA: TetR/AcrR family transcriptional regulator [Clostridia bacterium]|nr:TetR/AcrR family transcriptional regulator [Clostridia bacterium]
MTGTPDKKSSIIRAAFRLFAEKGFHHTTVDEIAALAGVGKGTVYEYFSSKQKLLQEMLLLASDYYFSDFTRHMEGIGDLKEKLKRLVELHFQFFVEHRDIARVVLFEHRYITEDLGDLLVEKEKRRTAYLAELLKVSAAQGEIRPVNFQVAAKMITGALWNMGLEMAVSEEETAGPELAGEILDILWTGLAPAEGARG